MRAHMDGHRQILRAWANSLWGSLIITQILSKLILFFQLYNYFLFKRISFSFEDNVISIRTGELIPKSCLTREEQDATKSASFIKIEEPFDLSNTARSVYDHYVFKEIRNVFKSTNLVLKSQKTYEAVLREKFGNFSSNSNYDAW